MRQVVAPCVSLISGAVPGLRKQFLVGPGEKERESRLLFLFCHSLQEFVLFGRHGNNCISYLEH